MTTNENLSERLDTYGYPMMHPASVCDQRREMGEYFARMNKGMTIETMQPRAYYACGICGSYHPIGYFGDCRNDLYRIADPDELHGAGGWEEIAMDDNAPAYWLDEEAD